MSDTPRTDAATRMAFSCEHMVEIEEAQKLERDLAQSKEANAGLMRACNNLERELAEAMDDAKTHKQMLQNLSKTHALERAELDRSFQFLTKQRDALAEALELFLSRVRYTSVFMNGNPTGGTFDYRSHGFDAEVELAHKALAATKGGQP